MIRDPLLSSKRHPSILNVSNISASRKFSQVSCSEDSDDNDFDDEEYEIWDNKDIRVTNLLLD